MEGNKINILSESLAVVRQIVTSMKDELHDQSTKLNTSEVNRQKLLDDFNDFKVGYEKNRLENMEKLNYKFEQVTKEFSEKIDSLNMKFDKFATKMTNEIQKLKSVDAVSEIKNNDYSKTVILITKILAVAGTLIALGKIFSPLLLGK